MSLEDIVTNRYIVIAPSLEHLYALQHLLGDKFPQTQPITLDEAKQVGSFTNEIIFIQCDYPIDYAPRNPELPLTSCIKRINTSGISGRDAFLAKGTIVLNDDLALPLRDITGWQYGDEEKDITSQEALSKFPDVLLKLGDQ